MKTSEALDLVLEAAKLELYTDNEYGYTKEEREAFEIVETYRRQCRAVEELNEKLCDMYISPEAMEDIKNWPKTEEEFNTCKK